MSSPRVSVASIQPDPRHLRIIAASAQANEARVRDILSEEPPWVSTTDLDALRQALQKVAARGKLSIVRLLIEHGADVNPKRDTEIPALVKAAEAGNVAVVSELLAHNADPNARNRSGQTALFIASIKGHNKVVEALANGRADVNAKDKEGRSPLLYLASEKKIKAKWTTETLHLLHRHGADTEVIDQIGRTPLLWAATNRNIELARFLLENRANVSAANNRGRTALHLSAESSDEEHRDDMVKLLLSHNANPEATSDGGWTPLHNAAQSGYLSTVALLLETKAKVNAELSNGMTPLHWAAFNGFEDIVRLLLTRPDVNTSLKDGFDRTPMLCAAEKHHTGIVQLLSPARTANRLTAIEERACKAFEATVVDFGQFEKKQLVSKPSVYDLLYGWNDELNKPRVSTLTKNLHYKPDFRWIHLPANNIAWVETLLAKSFIEAGHRDIESFKALEKCFDQEHRGPFAHAHFMRPFCHRIPSPRRDVPDKKEEKPLTTLSEDPSELSTKPSQDGDASISRNSSDVHDNIATKPETKKKGKGEQIAERHPKKSKRAKGPPGNPPQRQDSVASAGSGKPSTSLPWDTPRHAASHGKIVLFMPFLHYETDEKRRKMSDAIRCVHERKQRIDPPSRDSLLFEAYLNSTPPLHPRRTLDQFFYHGIDTSARDTDQVVYRFCKRYGIDEKVFMVDQLWLWVIGKDLVITSFPQRWDQPKNDPLNVLDGIIEETNAKTRPPIESVYDLAMLITSRCSGMFDRNRLDDQNYQFLDMFEASIGVVTDRESRLFSRFNRASAQSAQWLQRHRRRRTNQSFLNMGYEHADKDIADQFPDALLDIGVETSLLAEIKDIRDELNIIMGILDAQLQTVVYLEGFVTEEVRGEGSRRTTDAVVSEVRRRAGEQKRSLDAKQKDVSRMDRQALSLYDGLTDLLDLKQKHSNALEARFAGDQAVIAAKQGQTIMVFTIVTIVFLPLSFIASFFAINFVEWGDGIPLSIPYVSKYLFGIGFAISIPLVALAFTVQDISNKAINLLARARGVFGDSYGPARAKKKRARHDDDDDDDDVYPNADPPALKKALTREKSDFPKPSFSSRREDYYQPPPSRRGDLDSNQYDSNKAWLRPSFHSRERSDEYHGHRRLSPVSPTDRRRSANGNNITWAAPPGGVASGTRPRGLSQDLESGRLP
ncbi:hypothetical protein E0Z10_g5092 [Xylaria hypoxylon]|uniref:Uncharacterized protein n=1 Tax=Xylaria hypoxylon TaxID=37992 RepID=A0A4Z0YWT6_9PEZI|nr:hypothetical protein E0Z10_g5092 [Xylaria hypoxylon]